MFEFFKNMISGVKRMLSRAAIKRALGKAPELTSYMIERIELWNNMINGNAPWCDDYIKSMKIEHGICREFADVVLSEMEVSISNNKLSDVFNNCIEDLNENLQDGLALGALCIKPLGNGEAEFVTADRFIVLSFGIDRKPDDIVFIDQKKIDTSRYYMRLERHSIKTGHLVISNMAFESSDKTNLGRSILLTEVEEWSHLPEEVAYPGMKKMDFGYYKNPLKNRIDNTNCGISIYDDAIDIIQRVDTQGARLDWEFESGERAVHVDSTTLKKKPNGQNGLAKLNKRLYRGLDLDADTELLKEYSPEFRDENIVNGLETLLRQIEFIVGLSFGDLSAPQSVDKTATEIKAAKQRKYNRVDAIQGKLKVCLEDFLAGLAFHEGMYSSGYKFVCNFADSILTDEETERQLMLNEIAAGIRSHWEYRVRFLGEDEETAKRNLPEQNTVME